MNEAQLRLQYGRVLDRARAWGLTSHDLEVLPSVQLLINRQIQTNRKLIFNVNRSKSLLFFACCVFLLVIICYTIQCPSTCSEVLTFVFDILNLWEVLKEPCLLPLCTPFIALFRPPVDCSICNKITGVDRVSQLSRDVFEYRYAYSGRPVIITDAMTNWSAVDTFSFEFFRSVYSLDSPVLQSKENKCQFFPYRSNFHNLSEVFQMSDDRANLRSGSEPWYIGWSNCDGSAANILRSHYRRPYFLPDEAESSKTDWIFMGSPNFGADLHIDNVKNPSWQAQVLGSKLWTLEPPPECYLKCVNKIETVVNPGEIIVLDTNQWFHSTLIVGQEMSITIGSEYD